MSPVVLFGAPVLLFVGAMLSSKKFSTFLLSVLD